MSLTKSLFAFGTTHTEKRDGASEEEMLKHMQDRNHKATLNANTGRPETQQ